MTATIQKWWPTLDGLEPSMKLNLQQLFNSANDHDQAISALAGIVQKLQASSASGSSSTTTTQTTAAAAPSTGAQFPYLGTVNNQTGTSYTVQDGDNGALVAFTNSAPVAVSLNYAVSAPFFVFLSNVGPGTATLTPTQGKVNGASSLALNAGYGTVLFFDGANWHATAIPIVPNTTSAVSHQWLNSYNAATGQFGLSQPSASDVAPAAGATTARPTGAATGFMFFDTTKGYPVWWNGTGWVNSSGATA